MVMIGTARLTARGTGGRMSATDAANNGDHDATRIDCRDASSALRLHPGVRTGWRDGQPDCRYRRDLAAWHGTWFAGSPGRNPHGRHGARVARTQSGTGWHNRADRERHDM